jgi:tetratricopeptide (TPR) repeat protein
MSILNGRYELLEKLGEGGMAEVYRAIQISLDREVAIKFIKPSLTGDTQFAMRFEREAKAIGRLSHPHIMHVHAFEQAEDGRYFLVMEMLKGYSLADEIKSRKFTAELFALSDVLTITRSVAEALGYAHQQGVLHRDVKPHNIFLTDDNRVVVTDFGIAKVISEGQLTETGSTIGTPHYFAPEQGYGKPVDHRVDIYALGVVFYELLTLQVPFDADSMLGIIAQHANAPIPDPREKRPDLPEVVTLIVLRAMAKNPDDRYPDMGRLLVDLDKLRAEAPTEVGTIHMRAVKPVMGTVGTAMPDADAPTTVDTPYPRRASAITISRGRRLPVWIGLAVLLLILVVGGIVLFSKDETAEPDGGDSIDLAEIDIPPAIEGEYLVVVADFEGDESLGMDIAERIAASLRTGATAQTLGEDFRLEQAQFVITSPDDAQGLADATSAKVVIWGKNSPIGLEVTAQVYGYPGDTLQKMSFLLPTGEDFAPALVSDVPLASDLMTIMLISQQLIRDSQFIPILMANLNLREAVQGVEFRITPSTALDGYIFGIWTSYAANDLEGADREVSSALSLLPNDPMLLFMRWSVNGMMLGRIERAESDAQRLTEILPESPIGIYTLASTAFFAGDYDKLLALTDPLMRESPEQANVFAIYRDLALIRRGQFQQALDELDIAFQTDAEILKDYPALEPVRALVYEIQGNTAAAQADIETMRTSRLLETTAGLFLDPTQIGEYPDLLLFGAYVIEANGDLVTSTLGYQLGLAAVPDHYLLHWRRGVVMEQTGQVQPAYDAYLAAQANAPAPFPIALYQAAALVQAHGDELENPAEACKLLERSQADAETDPAFYAPLLEKITAAKREWGCS